MDMVVILAVVTGQRGLKIRRQLKIDFAISIIIGRRKA